MEHPVVPGHFNLSPMLSMQGDQGMIASHRPSKSVQDVVSVPLDSFPEFGIQLLP